MRKVAWLAIVALILVCILPFSSCSGQLKGSSPHIVSNNEETRYDGMVWNEINPPRSGLRCWAAQWDNESGDRGYGICYCEPVE